MKRLNLCILLNLCLSVFLCNSLLLAQHSNCPNSDFSNGTFDRWKAYFGNFENPDQNYGVAYERHKLIKAPGALDPFTCGELNTVPPGEAYSARLGNSNSGYEAEQLRYEISVTEETNLFIYRYAVVLEDPGHDPYNQPDFTIEVTDQSGQIIDPVCGYYYVYAQQGLPSWKTCGSVVWKDWTTVGIDMTPYMNQTVSIVFTTRDCGLGAHFGYAYLSAYCSRMQLVFGYCPDDTIATVTAPPGFTYTWDNGTTGQTTTIHNPVFGMTTSCTLTSANGCQVTISGTFKPTIVEAGLEFPPTCDGSPVHFTNLSTINQNEIVDWRWDFNDGSPPASGTREPTHIFPSYGPYEVQLIAYSTDGCPDTIVEKVELVKVPVVDFSLPASCSRKLTADTLYYHLETNLNVEAGYDKYAWSTGDTSNTIHLKNEGWYSVTIENAGICASSDSVNMLECYVDLYMPNAFTPDCDGRNDNFRPVTRPEKISNFKMIIYNRWGQNIFETRDLQGWDGKVEGQEMPMGVYSYSLTYEVPAGDQRNMKGSLTLLR